MSRISELIDRMFPKVGENGEAGDKKTEYVEHDNVGTRHETSQMAIGYWMKERPRRKTKEPFVMYEFSSLDQGRKALLEIPCIHQAKDSGKLICTKTLIFGCYQTDGSHCEAVLCGDDLTHDVWTNAHASFRKHGGTLKNELEPDRSSRTNDQSIGRVTFKKKEVKDVRNNFGITFKCTYEVHQAPNAATAHHFLKDKTITEKDYYIIVETPEGNYGKDRDGTFKEDA